MKATAAALFLFVLTAQIIFSQSAEPDALITFRGEGTGTTAAEARTAALNDASAQAARYMFTFVKSSYEEKLVYARENGTVLRDSESSNSESGFYSEITVSKIHISKEYPAERSGNGTYKMAIVSEISRAELERQKKQYIEDTSQRYTVQIRSVQDAPTVSEAIRGYERIRRSLAESPVRQSIAFFFNSTKNQLENCYDYCVSEIARLGGGIALSPIPELNAQKNDTIAAEVGLGASVVQNLGQIECLLRHDGIKMPTALAVQDNRIRFQIDTVPLPVGKYRGSIEVLLSSLSPGLKNISQGFSFEVTKIMAGCAVNFVGDIPAAFGAAEQGHAADTLTQSIRQFVQNSRLPIGLAESGDYCFVVTVNMKTYSAGLAGCAVAVSLENKGRVIAQSPRSSEAREFPASLDRLFAADFHKYIVNNAAFVTELEKVFSK